ncbi:hypothetical protein C9F11_04780 [Streptomyces sp. YIM 121038]|uniref:hypothetical protein n=1 Tax=Streptomyces sp. YIM 121038 TaxID=2136401 RepID=UPI0011103026|nr:hypothetical protein [Streptomyces sp. YIM 121038]QCX74659.1 hypothetical protein C9F11_04780 [Streptomyces sp. YIM 121038]
MLAVPVDVAVDELVVVRGARAPVEHLLTGQFLEDQLLVVVDTGGLRLRSGDDGGRARCGRHDRGHRLVHDGVGRLRGRGFGAGFGSGGLLLADLLPPAGLGPRFGRHLLVQLLRDGRAALALGGAGHRGLDCGRDHAALDTAVGLLLGPELLAQTPGDK